MRDDLQHKSARGNPNKLKACSRPHVGCDAPFCQHESGIDHLALNMKTVQNFRPPDGQNWHVVVRQLAVLSIYRPWFDVIAGQGLHCCSRDGSVNWI